jgi:endonuclease G
MKILTKLLIITGLLLSIAILFNSCRQPIVSDNPNLLMGNPSQATTDPRNDNNYLILRPQYALSYSRQKGTANWASWQLNASWFGSTPRQQNFKPDEDLPEDWYRVKSNDYTGSGFDRGHLVNSEDRRKTLEDNMSTFLMTNIVPQSPDNNRGVWVKLENYCRVLVREGKELYIIAGVSGEGGTGEKGPRKTLARGNIIIPKYLWKVVLVLDRPNGKVADVTANSRSIAVIIPNQQGVKNDPWEKYQTSIDQVEKLTGYDFFNNVPTSIQEAIERRTS